MESTSSGGGSIRDSVEVAALGHEFSDHVELIVPADGRGLELTGSDRV
ncbi:MAG: hypothetical protein ACR2RV_19640 [Verrucomicrobiales bacterium]